MSIRRVVRRAVKRELCRTRAGQVVVERVAGAASAGRLASRQLDYNHTFCLIQWEAALETTSCANQKVAQDRNKT